MPWSVQTPMSDRRDFINEYLQGTTSMRVLCACYGISRRVGYKWLTRFLVEGDTVLRDRAPAAVQARSSRAAHLADPGAQRRVDRGLQGSLRVRPGSAVSSADHRGQLLPLSPGVPVASAPLDRGVETGVHAPLSGDGPARPHPLGQRRPLRHHGPLSPLGAQRVVAKARHSPRIDRARLAAAECAA